MKYETRPKVPRERRATSTMRTARRLTLALVALALVAAACGDDDAPTTSPPTTAATTTAAPTTATPTTGTPGTDAPATTAPPATTAAPPTTAPLPVGGELTLVTNDAFAGVDYMVLPLFPDTTGVDLTIIAGGDVGTMVNQAILTKDNPLGDVLYGFDNTFLSRLLDEDLFIPYRSPLADQIPAEFQVAGDIVTAVDFGDVCINFDKAGLTAAGLGVPATLDDLRKPEYASSLVIENPLTSSPGLAFMLATIDEYGEGGWLDFWADLRDNDVQIVPGWTEAYYTNWSLYGGGQPLVVSYASSPPAEVFFADPQPDVAPSGVMEASCFRQIEYIGILKGTENLGAARALIDWWLSDALQSQLPLNYFVFPITPNTALPDVFVQHTAVPAETHILDPAVIATNRERWLEEWADVVLR